MVMEIKEDKKYLVEEPDTDRANDLMNSGEWRVERYSETKGAWLLVRRHGR